MDSALTGSPPPPTFPPSPGTHVVKARSGGPVSRTAEGRRGAGRAADPWTWGRPGLGSAGLGREETSARERGPPASSSALWSLLESRPSSCSQLHGRGVASSSFKGDRLGSHGGPHGSPAPGRRPDTSFALQRTRRSLLGIRPLKRGPARSRSRFPANSRRGTCAHGDWR